MNRLVRVSKHCFKVIWDQDDDSTFQATERSPEVLMRDIDHFRMTSNPYSSSYPKVFANLIGAEDGTGIFAAPNIEDFLEVFKTVIAPEDRLLPDAWDKKHPSRGKLNLRPRRKK
jgi:hypothetical protein